MQPESIYFNTKIPGKQVLKNVIQLISFNYYKGKSAKEIVDMFSLKIRIVYNIAHRAEKGRLELKGSIGSLKKMIQRVKRKIIKTVYDSLQSSTRGLVCQVEKDLVFIMKPSEMLLKNTNTLQERL